jgi:hypothetical protein
MMVQGVEGTDDDSSFSFWGEVLIAIVGNQVVERLLPSVLKTAAIAYATVRE